MEVGSTCAKCSSSPLLTVPCGLCTQVMCEVCRAEESVKLHSVAVPGLCIVCKDCHSRVCQLEALQVTEQLVWGRNSPRGKRWFEASGALQLSLQTRDTVYTYSSLSADDADTDMIEKDVAFGRTDPNTFHWEYSELIHRICDLSCSKAAYRDPIMRVLKAVCCRNGDTGYCQGLNFVASWLLMFMEENAAFWVLTKIIGDVLVPGFYKGDRTGNSLNGFYIESGVIASFLENFNPSYQRTGLPSLEFADFFSLQLLIQLFVDSTDLASCIFLWDQLISEGVIPIQAIALIRGSLSLVSLMRGDMERGEHPILLLKRLPDKQLRPQLRQAYMEASGQATQARVDRLRTQLRDIRAKQWRDNELHVFREIERASHFTREEIRLFQGAFNQLLKDKVRRAERRQPAYRGFSHQSVKVPVGLDIPSEEPELGIAKEEFLTLVERFCPNLGEFAGELFDRYDEDKSGYLDFRELMVCMSLLSKGSFDEKLRVCYDLFDYDHSGYLSSFELDQLISSLSHHLEASNSPAYVTQALAPVRSQLRRLLKDDGMVAWKEFYQCVVNDPLLFQVFAQHLETAGRYSAGRVVKAVGALERPRDPLTQKRCYDCVLE